MMWDCPDVQNFWSRVAGILTELLSTHIPTDPILFLLNDDSKLELVRKKQKTLFCGLTAAKKLLVQRWLPPHDLSTKKWLSYFHDIVLLEQSASRINKAKPETLEMWSHLANKIKTKLLEF